MEFVDVAIVGGGPAGSSCAAFCAAAGLRTLLIEREKFPREKVCGDCINPACWPVLHRLGVAEKIRHCSHEVLKAVEFVSIGDRKLRIQLPTDNDNEIAIKRSLFDYLLLSRAREAGAQVHEESIVTALTKTASDRSGPNDFTRWKIDTVKQMFAARFLVGADGRNSTVARLRGLLPGLERERVALQAHIPLPKNFGERVVLQFLPEGYSGQAPVNANELNLCLVGRPPTISSLKSWAEKQFEIPPDQIWRTITPLTRDPIRPARENLLFIGDAARVVEPFTGEGIYYALRSGELAANAIVKITRSANPRIILSEFARAHSAMYRHRLWINRLARAAVLSPKIASVFLRNVPFGSTILRSLTRKIAG